MDIVLIILGLLQISPFIFCFFFLRELIKQRKLDEIESAKEDKIHKKFMKEMGWKD